MIQKIIETIYYLLTKFDAPVDKLKLIKLVFLADKYHLIKHSRTVTGDRYCIMPLGQVGSDVKNVLDGYFYKDSKNYFSKPIDNKKIQIQNKRHTLNSLSLTDKQAIDYIFSLYGKMSTSKIVDFVHQYPEYQKYKDLLKTRGSIPINISEIISVIDGDKINTDNTDLNLLKDIINEN